jgi:NADH/NAD ratio-sensing transcriptional regulator Rex
MRDRRISESTIHRLSHYYRALTTLEREHFDTVSSKELANREELTPAQVRKDLSFSVPSALAGWNYP